MTPAQKITATTLYLGRCRFIPFPHGAFLIAGYPGIGPFQVVAISAPANR